ncbi:MAG: hypothetical protein ACFFCZ_10280 [Promethearchaeota archaeon]
MQQNQSSKTLALLVIVVILTGFDYLLDLLVDFDENSFPLLIILFPLAIIILVLTFMIWKIILTEESEKSLHRTLLLIAAMLTIVAGLMSLFIYSIEIILSSGVLGTAYFELDLTSNQNEIGLAFPLMVLAYLSKFLLNISGLLGCLLTSIVWSRQFAIWARFSEAPFIKSLYFAGVAMIILFLDQMITLIIYYIGYWFYGWRDIPEYPPAIQAIIMILLLIAVLMVPISAISWAIAGQRLRIPYEQKEKSSLVIIILPLIFIFLWACVQILKLPGSTIQVDPLVANLIVTLFLVAIFIPISLGFWGWARKVDSPKLRENLYLATVGTLALSMFTVVAVRQWIGMTGLPSYLLAFSILTWSLANISRYLGSREALWIHLREAGDRFLTELAEAEKQAQISEMKVQSAQEMTKILAYVSKWVMDIIDKMCSEPPTLEEICGYIVSCITSMTSINLLTLVSEKQIESYVDYAFNFAEKDDLDKEKYIPKYQDYRPVNIGIGHDWSQGRIRNWINRWIKVK